MSTIVTGDTFWLHGWVIYLCGCVVYVVGIGRLVGGLSRRRERIDVNVFNAILSLVESLALLQWYNHLVGSV